MKIPFKVQLVLDEDQARAVLDALEAAPPGTGVARVALREALDALRQAVAEATELRDALEGE
jgi:hypothetical protein